MTTWIAVLFLAAAPAPTDEEAVAKAVKEYHAAFEAGDAARVLAVLGPTYFIGDEKSAGGKERMSAHFFKVRRDPAGLAEELPHELGPLPRLDGSRERERPRRLRRRPGKGDGEQQVPELAERGDGLAARPNRRPVADRGSDHP